MNALEIDRSDANAKSEMNAFLKEWHDMWIDPHFKEVVKLIKSSDYYLKDFSVRHTKHYSSYKFHMPLAHLAVKWVEWSTPDVTIAFYSTYSPDALEALINHINDMELDTANKTVFCECDITSSDDEEGERIYEQRVDIPLALIQLANGVSSLKATLIAFLYLVHGFAIGEEKQMLSAQNTFNTKLNEFKDSLSSMELLCFEEFKKANSKL